MSISCGALLLPGIGRIGAFAGKAKPVGAWGKEVQLLEVQFVQQGNGGAVVWADEGFDLVQVELVEGVLQYGRYGRAHNPLPPKVGVEGVVEGGPLLLGVPLGQPANAHQLIVGWAGDGPLDAALFEKILGAALDKLVCGRFVGH